MSFSFWILLILLIMKKSKPDLKQEKKSFSQSLISSTQKAQLESSLSSSLSPKPKKEKKANLAKEINSEDSISLSFINKMDLSDQKDSDKKSVLTKLSQDVSMAIDPNDPLVKQVKEITDQVKEDHKSFLKSLSELLSEHPMENKCIQ